MRKPVLLIFSLGLILIAASGCQERAAKADGTPPPAISVDVTNPETGATLHVQVDHDSIPISARIIGEISIQWKSPAWGTLETPAFEEYGWTVVSHLVEPTRFEDGVYSIRHRFVLEPYLAGEYSIPPVVAHVSTEADHPMRTIESAALPIVVRSVLQADDTPQLAPALGFLDPNQLETSSDDYSSLLIVGVVAGLVVFLALAWAIARSGRAAALPPPTALQLLQSVADESIDSERAYDTLYRALMLLDSRLLGTREIGEVVGQCERAMFSSSPAQWDSPTTMARHTLGLLGQQEERAA